VPKCNPPMSTNVGRTGVALLLLHLVACAPEERSPRDRELEEIAGIRAFVDWRCTPEGPRRFSARLRRGARCYAEQRDTAMLTVSMVERDPAGHVVTVIRSWGLSDSLQWVKLRDSVAAALATRTKASRQCPSRLDSTMTTQSPSRYEVRLWRLPHYDLGISTSVTPIPLRPLLQLKVEAHVHGFVVCGRSNLAA
jgi:hypothetical protein